MLIEKLDKYLENDYYPFHMPGHKRNTKILNKNLPYNRDITEISGFDNLNDPKDLFVDMENKLKEIYKAYDFIISTNGSTCGILASIRTLTKDNKKVLIQRNSHKSVYNAIDLFNLDSDYINLKIKDDIVYDIDYDDLKEKCSKNSYAFILITSPTYEGFIIDLKKIREISPNTKIILDMAHGSHIILDKIYDKLDFDVAITSFHKNLSALTPSSGIIIKNKNIDNKSIRKNMAIFQTSSPSYLILQSIDDMILNFDKFPKLYKNLCNNLENLYKTKLNNLKFINHKNKDISKIVISTKNTNIKASYLQKLLYNEKIEIEMANSTYLILIASIFDDKEGFNRLIKALKNIDKKIDFKKSESNFSYNIALKKLSINKALSMKSKLEHLDRVCGKISADFIYAYPPGIPLIVPGEVFDDKIISNIKNLQKNSIELNIDNSFVSILD